MELNPQQAQSLVEKYDKDRRWKEALTNPAFQAYGEYGFRMTEWLLGDTNSNPLASEPLKWHTVGRIAFLDRTVSFPSIAGAANSLQNVNLGGGKNVILFARVASVVAAAAPVGAYTVLPNEQSSYVDVQIQRQSGFIDVERAPIANNFGMGYAPNIRPVPELWLGNEVRAITVWNRSLTTVRVDLTFTLALLDTGR